MRIKFIKEYRAIPLSGGIDNDWGCYKNEVKDVHDDQGQWLIDNGFAEKVKESSWWKPKYDEEYFYVGHDGLAHCCIWRNDELDNGRLKLGLVFKTEEAIVRCCDYLEAVEAISHDDGFMTPFGKMDGTRYGFGIFCDWEGNLCAEEKNHRVLAGEFYFDNEENAEKSIDSHPNEWKIILNYDWRRE